MSASGQCESHHSDSSTHDISNFILDAERVTFHVHAWNDSSCLASDSMEVYELLCDGKSIHVVHSALTTCKKFGNVVVINNQYISKRYECDVCTYGFTAQYEMVHCAALGISILNQKKFPFF